MPIKSILVLAFVIVGLITTSIVLKKLIEDKDDDK